MNTQRCVTLARTSHKAEDAIQGLWNEFSDSSELTAPCRDGVGDLNAGIHVLSDSKGRRTFSVRDQIVNIFGFATYTQSASHSLFFNPLKC